jgi:hypothetical protein
MLTKEQAKIRKNIKIRIMMLPKINKAYRKLIISSTRWPLNDHN